jgi:predicted membrane protein
LSVQSLQSFYLFFLTISGQLGTQSVSLFLELLFLLFVLFFLDIARSKSLSYEILSVLGTFPFESVLLLEDFPSQQFEVDAIEDGIGLCHVHYVLEWGVAYV